MWRAGFGPAAAQLAQLPQLTTAQVFASLQKEAAQTPVAFNVANDYLTGIMMGVSEGQQGKTLDAETRRQIQQQQRQALRNLNLTWMQEMATSKAQLREKTALFWHGHFACRSTNIFYQQQLLHVLRSNALGSFRTLLHQASKSAAMLQFLNAAQNKKGRPNENFAREVMELFTLGRGQYTEKDIKEAARAFTGWGHAPNGEFLFRTLQHDDGTKTIFGKTANFTGEEVLDLLLEQKSTAQYITKKIYRAFVNEEVDAEKVAMLADRFYKSDYNIAALMQDIFTGDGFYDEKHIGCKIKSPVELLVGIQRMLPLPVEKRDSLLVMQRLLGQILFYPPNVAGWPGGKSWIDSTTLVTRMRLPQLLYNAETLQLQPKDDDDQMMGKKELEIGSLQKSVAKEQGAEKLWDNYVKGFQNILRPQLMDHLRQALLQSSNAAVTEVLAGYIDSSSRENFIKSATLQIMSLPEYQVC